jgi:di/tricarboxylate transporter
MSHPRSRLTVSLLTVLSGCAAATLLWPTPAGLTPAGQRVMAIAILAVGLWSTEVIPMTASAWRLTMVTGNHPTWFRSQAWWTETPA